MCTINRVDAIAELALSSAIEDAPVTYDPKAGIWRLFRRWRVKLTIRGIDTTLTIPRGFPFDLASIPRLLTRLIAKFELGIEPPLVHDYLYTFRGRVPKGRMNPYFVLTREECDGIFLDLMTRRGISRWRRNSAYWAVRSFGWAAWASHEERA